MDLSQTVYHNGPGKNLMLLALNFVFVAIGVWMIVSGEGVPGWIVSIFFGLCALVSAFALLDRRPRLVLDHEGITDRTLGVGKIRWSDIDHAALRAISSAWFIELQMQDDAKSEYMDKLSATKKKLSRGNRLIDFSELNINITGVRGKPEDIFATLTRYLSSAKSA